MGYDLADAYQQVPNLPAQRRRFVFTVGQECFVWLVGMFGIATMSAIFGQLCDVSCVWLEHRFASVRARHFADDHMILHDAELGPPSEATIYEEVERFGWKVHPTKRFTWTRRFTLLGFVWDLDAGTVTLTEEKRDKYLRKLTAFLHLSRSFQCPWHSGSHMRRIRGATSPTQRSLCATGALRSGLRMAQLGASHSGPGGG
ncbi:hypothetical protein CF336_g9241 [Tilletia laevis]|nr:hypothetical protein CF336_g9241 [Tilletia laevis]